MDIPEHFDAVCRILSEPDVATMYMIPEIHSLVALFSMDIHTSSDIKELLSRAASHGHERLVKCGMLSCDSITQERCKWPIARMSFANNHLALARWIHTSFHLSAEDVRTNDNSALKLACFMGHFDVLKYLHTEFHLTAEDARYKYNFALSVASQYGHYDVVKYLHLGFHLTAKDAQAYDKETLRVACANGHLRVIKYLCIEFEQSLDDIQANLKCALEMASSIQRLDVINYLCTEFQMTIDDALRQGL
jgi:hypothetical protein